MAPLPPLLPSSMCLSVTLMRAISSSTETSWPSEDINITCSDMFFGFFFLLICLRPSLLVCFLGVTRYRGCAFAVDSSAKVSNKGGLIPTKNMGLGGGYNQSCTCIQK